MKFSSFLVFASLAFAAPNPVKPRQQTVVGTVVDAVNTLQGATAANFDEIKQVIDTAEDSVSAEVEARLRANYQAILAALQQATNTIVSVTTGALGGLVAGATGLTAAQINNLRDAVNTVRNILAGLSATIEVTASDLSPDIQAAIQTEVDAVKAAVSPFLGPVLLLVSAVRQFSATATVAITGLTNAQREVIGLFTRLANSIGLPGLNAVLGLAAVFAPLP